MVAPTPYLHLPGTARQALHRYAEVFGGDVELHTLAEFGRTDSPPDAVAHGMLTGGPVSLYVADAVGEQAALVTEGMMLALLGAAPSATLGAWFAALAQGGRVVDDLQRRPWGASDGQVVDRFGVHWLIGFEGD